MNSRSILLNSAGTITCGTFSILMTLFIIGSPAKGVHEEICPVNKGARPYKMDVSDMDYSDIYMKYTVSKRETLFSPIIIEAADRHDVDPALVKAIIMAESGYNPMATSKKGAMGLMQIMPRTATAFSTEDMYDPVHNINVGVKYVKKLLNQFDGDMELMLAAYNAGSRKVREYKGIPPYEATRNYIKAVSEYYEHYQDE